MSEIYKAVYDGFREDIEKWKGEIFPIIPISFVQINQLAMIAATVAENVVNGHKKEQTGKIPPDEEQS